MSILMLKVVDASGEDWNLNLAYIVAVQLPKGGPVTSSTRITNEMVHLYDGQVVQLPPGTWDTAIQDLLDQFPGGTRQVGDELFIGGAP